MSSAPLIRLVASPAEYAGALAVRVRVFVEEQIGPADEEPDAWDVEATHFVVIDGDRVVGTARVVWLDARLAKIGRVALLPAWRGRGWGRALMEAVLEHCLGAGAAEVVLHAQTYALGFYGSLGFTPVGPEFVEAGIPHRRMRRRVVDEAASGGGRRAGDR